MDENERNEKYETQVDELYRAIGKCCVAFEHVSQAMRFGITFLLDTGGLANQRLSQIMLADLTAYPLKSILQAMIGEVAALSPEDQRICGKIFSRTDKLIKQRNDIIHSTWLVGWAAEQDTDFSQVSGSRPSRGKSGAAAKSLKYTAQDFDNFTNECQLVKVLVNRLWVCVNGGVEIAKSFVYLENGDVSVPNS